MKNPLNKRFARDLKKEIVKYLAIFLFMSLTIGFISGFLIAGDSMKKAYDESFEKYDIENGHFVVDTKLKTTDIRDIENNDVTIHEMFYYNLEANNDSVLRTFKNRKEVNKVCVMKGELPSSDDEIAIDRMYADNNKLAVGDSINVNGRDFEISGLVALSDFSALFSDNKDTMFDAIKFGVAIVSDNYFDNLDCKDIRYCYSWKYSEEPENEEAEKDASAELAKSIYLKAQLRDYVPRYVNSAINFTGDDIGKDKSMMQVLLYILIVIMAFVFVITINHSITAEASAIGTLRASGYSRRDMLFHYMTLPVLVTLAACVVGNVLGYTVFKTLISNLYYASYSLPTYVTRWNANAFIQTTLIPLMIMTVIIVGVIGKRLRISPLKFIRHDFKGKRKSRSIKLPNIKFFDRFRLRIIFQNMPSYIILLFGITFASVLLLFGMMMRPLLEKYNDDTINNMIANYQYILKDNIPTKIDGAEKISVCELKEGDEEIIVYGLNKNSDYLKLDLSDKNKVAVSNTYADKFKVKVGDTITLKEEYGNRKFSMEVEKIVVYPASLCVFTSRPMVNFYMGKASAYFNGYLSDKELTDIDSAYIVSEITEDDLTKMSRQLDVSMGNMFNLVNIFAVILSALLIFLLTKIIIEKNSSCIAMCKILGYTDGEVSRLYLLATTWAVIVSIIAGLGLSTLILKALYRPIMDSFNGWIPLYLKPLIYPEMFVMIFAAYMVIALIQFFRIKKIPKDQALKNFE